MTLLILSRSASFATTATIVNETFMDLVQGVTAIASAQRLTSIESVIVSRPKAKPASLFSDFAAELLAENPAMAAKVSAARQKISRSLPHEGKTLRRLRMEKGLSQAALAEMIGTSQSHIARLEKNPSSMLLDTAERLGGVFDVDKFEIMQLESTPPKLGAD